MPVAIFTVTTNLTNDLVNESHAGTLANLSITGDGQLQLIVQFDQSMNTQAAVTPVISFPGATSDLTSSIALDTGYWQTTTNPNDTYVFVFDVLDADVDLVGVDIEISNARSLIGDDLADTTVSDVFDIDTLIPDVPGTAPDLTDGTDLGNNTTDDLTSDNTPTFTVTLPGSGLEAGDIVQLVSGGTIYAEYEIDGMEGATVDITVGSTVAGSSSSVEATLPETVTTLTVDFLDNAGNTRAGSASIDVDVDVTAPTVVSMTLDDTSLISGESATLTVVFSEAVENLNAADFSVDSGTISEPVSTDGGTTWTAIFSPATDTQAPVNAIALNTTYNDLAGNTGTSASTANYAVDTLLPTVTDVSISDPLINEADAEGGMTPVTITVTFSEDMDQTVDPTVALNGAGANNTLSATGGSWTSATTYEVSYLVLDNNVEVPSISVDVLSARDVAGNVMTNVLSRPIDNPSEIDTLAPTASITLDTEITADDIVNSAESSGLIDISGIVGGDVQDNDTVTLTVDGSVVGTGLVSGGAFTILVDGMTLAAATSPEITASVTTFDAAGNSTTVTDTETYSVDLRADDPADLNVTSTMVADTFVNAAERAAFEYVVNGIDGDATATVTFSNGVESDITATFTDVDNGTLQTIDLSALTTDGPLTVTVEATDIAGNTDSGTGFSATLDTTADAGGDVAVLLSGDESGSTIYVNDSDDGSRLDFTITGMDDPADVATVTLTDSVGTSQSYSYTGANPGPHLVDLWNLGFADGVVTATVSVTDAAGNTATGTGDTIILDSDGDVGDDFAITINDTDGLLSNAELGSVSFTITGVDPDVSAGASAEFFAGGQTVSVHNLGNGTHTVDLSSLPDGPLHASAYLVDDAGNDAISANDTSVIDTTADVGGDATVVINDGDSLVSQAESGAVSYTVSGLDADATATVRFTDGYTNVDVAVTANGTFTNADLSTLMDGPITASLLIGDAAGNSANGTPDSTTLDTTADLNADLTVAPDTGYDVINNAESGMATFVVSGLDTADATGIITITDSLGGSVQSGPISDNGTVMVSVSTLADGALTITLDVTDAAGNTAQATSSATLDTTADVADGAGADAPLAVVVDDANGLINAAEFGSVSFTVSGVDGDIPAGATVTFSDSDSPANEVEVTGLANGSHTVNLAGLIDGPLTVTIEVTDAAGNTATGTPDTSATIDTTAPDAPIITGFDHDTQGTGINDATPTINGTGEAGATVTVTYTVDAGSGAGAPMTIAETAVVDGMGQWTITPSASLVALFEGEQTLSFTATQTDPAGNTSAASMASTLYLDFAPEFIDVTQDAGTATELADSVSPPESGLSETSGVLTFEDIPSGQTYGIGISPNGAPFIGTFEAGISDGTLTDTQGSVEWTFEVDNALIDNLAVGESIVQTYNLTLIDGGGLGDASDPLTVTVTIEGTNDAPQITVTATEDQAAVTETNLPLIATDTLAVSDVDTSDTVTATSSFQSSVGDAGTLDPMDFDGMFSVTAGDVIGDMATTGNIVWTFNSGMEAFDHLNATETLTLNFLVTATDTQMATDTQVVTITITGTNDAPTLSAGTGAAVEDGPTVNVSLAALANDLDAENDGTNLTYNVVTQPGEGSATIVGTDLVFDPGNDFQDLFFGETRDVTVRVSATDAEGESVENDVVITVTGVNDDPTLGAGTMNATEGDTGGVTLDISTLADDID
ncbi:Ig-like domain-containing protein, partial [Shimia sp. SDUM112013]|uniref:beta strand repeat-containing protein n=1 Tax=Shimia sp. SDUM112013 TaxID=3136160 RepID=UPI0032ED9236